MNGKQILAILIALAILLLLYFSAMGYSKANDTLNDGRLIFEDRQLDNETLANIEFYNMTNVTSMSTEFNIQDLNQGMIATILNADIRANDELNYSLHVLYYNNGNIEIYRYVADSINNSFWRNLGGGNWVLVQWMDFSNETSHFILGPAQDGDVLKINYSFEDLITAYDVGNWTLRLSLGEYSYTYVMESVVATNPIPSGDEAIRRMFSIGSQSTSEIGWCDFSIDNLKYKAMHYNTTMYNISENFTLQYGHYFSNVENLTSNNQTYAFVNVISPARVYILDAPESAPAAPIYINPDVIVSIKTWFLENAWWIIMALFAILIVDIWIDAHDFYQDKKGGRS